RRPAPARNLRGGQQQLAYQGRRISVAAGRCVRRANGKCIGNLARHRVDRGNPVRLARILAWTLVALAIAGIAALALLRSGPNPPQQSSSTAQSNFGGPFTLVDGDGKPFSSQALEGKPYAIYFGFTRCGDVCPTTLARLVKLRRE